MREIELAVEVVESLLAESGREVGARLKQRLRAELIRRGAPPFDERAFGFRKFSDFLRAHESKFEIVRPDGPGDVVVSLRAGGQPGGGGPGVTALTETPRIRNEVWQAFTNPDPDRRRFLDLRSGQVRHFHRDEPESPARREVEAHPANFVEIQPVPAAEQQRWMAEYLSELACSPGERAALGLLAAGPYTSQLNAVFTTALAGSGEAWRRRRASGVVKHVQAWANSHGLSLQAVLEPAPALAQEPVPESPSPQEKSPVPAAAASTSARERVGRLLDLLSDRDVEDLVLPLLLSAVWTSSRRSE